MSELLWISMFLGFPHCGSPAYQAVLLNIWARTQRNLIVRIFILWTQKSGVTTYDCTITRVWGSAKTANKPAGNY